MQQLRSLLCRATFRMNRGRALSGCVRQLDRLILREETGRRLVGRRRNALHFEEAVDDRMGRRPYPCTCSTCSTMSAGAKIPISVRPTGRNEALQPLDRQGSHRTTHRCFDAGRRIGIPPQHPWLNVPHRFIQASHILLCPCPPRHQRWTSEHKRQSGLNCSLRAVHAAR